MALESAWRCEIPARAAWLRALMLERERVANHLGDLGALGNDAALSFGLTQFSRLREDWQRCVQCGAEHDRHANAACCAWRWTREGLEQRLDAFWTQSAGREQQTKALIEVRKKGIADKRRTGRTTKQPLQKEHDEAG